MKASGLYRGFVIAFTLIMCGITWFTEATAFGVIPATGGPVGLIVCVVLGALFVGVGNYLPRIRQNYTFGVRMVLGVSDETNKETDAAIKENLSWCGSVIGDSGRR